MDKQILQLLEITEHQYEMLIIGNYIKWCNKFDTKENDSQRLLTAPALFNWWLTEYKKLEKNFLEIALPYKGRANSCVLHDLYNEETIHIHKLFSKPLIYIARHKRQVVTANPLHN